MSVILGLIIVIFVAIFGMLTGFLLYGIGKSSAEEEKESIRPNYDYSKQIQYEQYRDIQRQLYNIDTRLKAIECCVLPDEEVRANELKKMSESMNDDTEDDSQK